MSPDTSTTVTQVSNHEIADVAERIEKKIKSGSLRGLLTELSGVCAQTTKAGCSSLLGLIPRLSVEAAMRPSE